MSLQLIREAMDGEAVSVGAPFFNLTFVPLMILAFCVLPAGPLLAWKRGDAKGVARKLWIVLAAAAAAAGFTPLPLVLAALFCYIASIGCISPNTGALAMAGQGARAGTGSALMGAMQFGLGMVTGTVVATIGQTALPLLGMMAVCAIVALLLGLRITREEPAA